MRVATMVLAAFLLANGAGRATPEAPALGPGDFAYGRDIDVPAGGPVYEIELPEGAYRAVRGADLRDVRVFNAAGRAVPHGLQHRGGEERSAKTRAALPFFPVEGEPADATTVIEINEDRSGKAVRARFHSRKAGKMPVTRAYVADLRDAPPGLARLEFEWSAASLNCAIPVAIEASDDLKGWRRVADGVLGRWERQGSVLEQKDIALEGATGKYLKITWEGDGGFDLRALHGEFVADETVAAPKTWSHVPPQPGGYAARGQVFASVFPVESIRVALAGDDALVRLSLSSGDTAEGPWTPRYTGTAYRMKVEGQEIVSPPVRFEGPITDRFWRLEAADGKTPTLEFGWVPHRLLFLAEGAGPYTLAYGSAAAPQAGVGFATLLENLKADRDGKPVVPQRARWAGTQKELGGAAKLLPPPVRAWKRWLLWAVLAGAVLAIAAMARQLYRELA